MERDLELEDATSHQKIAKTNQDLFSYMSFSVFLEAGTIKTNVFLGFTLGQISDLLTRKKNCNKVFKDGRRMECPVPTARLEWSPHYCQG